MLNFYSFMNYVMDFTRSARKAEDGVVLYAQYAIPLAAALFTGDSGPQEFVRAQFKFSVASPRGANQKMVQHDTG